jgi:ABC-type phosphate transport system substrate-binding protein
VARLQVRVPVLALTLGLVLAAGGASGQPGTSGATPRFTSGTLPRLDGSTSAEPILALLACRSLGLTCRWGTLDGTELPRSMRPLPPVEQWPPVFPRSGDGVPKLLTSSTHEAYARLVAGRVDLVVVARQPSEPETRMAREASVPLRITPIAWDGLVFVVNRRNAIGGLTLDQVRAIYAGKGLRWADVGGDSPDPIRPLVRNPGSGSAELFARHVMASPAGEPAGDRLIMTMMGLIDAVGTRPGDLGYTVYYYAKAFLEAAARAPWSGGPHFRLIAIDGVEPTDETIAGGAYRLREPVYAVSRKDAPGAVAALHDWLESPEGQRLVSETGYLPVRVSKH